MLEVLYHQAEFGGGRTSPTATATKNVEYFVCNWFVRHAFMTDCAHDFALKALQYRNGFDRPTIGIVNARSTFSLRRQLATPQNTEVKKRQNLGFIAARRQNNVPIETKFGM